MPIQDLREWMSETEAMGELTRVDGADPHLELGGLVDLYQWDMENPALLFDHIKGYPQGYRLLANVFTSMRRVALSLNMPVDLGRREFVAGSWNIPMVLFGGSLPSIRPLLPDRLGQFSGSAASS